MVLKHLKKKKKIRLKRKSQNSHDLIFALLTLASWMDFSQETISALFLLKTENYASISKSPNQKASIIGNTVIS